MKVRYLLDGVEKEGDAKNLSTLGAFVQTDGPVPSGPVSILLQAPGESITIQAQVADASDNGFSVIFEALEFSTLERLASALEISHPQEKKSPVGEIMLPDSDGDMMEIQTEHWTPPVTEPAVHEWKPTGDLLTPPPEMTGEGSHHELPTLSKAPAPTPSRRAKQANTSTPHPDKAGEQTEPADKRQAIRHDMSIPVTFDNLTGLIKEFTHNISYGGMFVYTTEPMKENSEIAITLVHPVHGQRLTLLAKVVHSSDAPSPDPVSGKQRYGLGIEFRLPLDELKRVLSDFIGSHQNQIAAVQFSQVLNDARKRLELAGQSPYSLLGLDSNADQNQIRQAYFKLVDQFHPDRYFGKVTDKDRKILEELFRALTKAYEELTV